MSSQRRKTKEDQEPALNCDEGERGINSLPEEKGEDAGWEKGAVDIVWHQELFTV